MCGGCGVFCSQSNQTLLKNLSVAKSFMRKHVSALKRRTRSLERDTLSTLNDKKMQTRRLSL